MHDKPSKLFRLFLWLIRPLRHPYLWTKRKWMHSFEKRLDEKVNLDTSRMLTRFNSFHRFFFGDNLEKIRFDEAELEPLIAAMQKGPLVFLMRNWGQVEYNFFNELFLSKKLPLVVHNNLIKMGHWMPFPELKAVVWNKMDRFFTTKLWPYNEEFLDLPEKLRRKDPVLFCLNLASGIHWMEGSHEPQQAIFEALLQAQQGLNQPIQLIPLHFIYDKHPGRAKKSLWDILWGEKENPGYLRKIFLFLRNFKKRAVAKIGEPLDFNILVKEAKGVAPENLPLWLAGRLQRTFDLESKQVTGPKLKSRRQIVAQILQNPKMRQKIRAASDAQNLSFEQAEKKTNHYLREIAGDFSFTLIELWDFILGWLFHTLWDGIEVDEAGIQKIKKVAKNSPLVLVPCHKSHVDYMLLAYVFYQYDLSLPYVCAGINLSFWPIGPLFRKSGAYFIRRTMPPDPFYPLALKGYVNELMREGFFQEFFIEGTRSRSGKLFPPRTGLLTTLMESFEEGGLEDVYFVPVAIGYERIVEENSYLQEIKGAKKKKEKWTDLFTLPKFLKRRYGKIHLEFNDPLSLKEALQSGAEDKKEFVKSFAQQICLDINEVTTLLPSPLVAAALLTQQAKSISREEIHQKISELYALARKLKSRLSESLKENCHFASEEVLEQFVKEGLVRLHQGLKEEFFTVPEESRLHLDFFKNKGIHVFARPALYQLCTNHHGKILPSPLGGEGSRVRGDQAGYQSFLIAEDLLQKEFFFPTTPYNIDTKTLPPWLYRLVLPILESYWLTLYVTEHSPFEKLEEKILMHKILTEGEILKLKGTLQFSESLSRFNIQNSIQRFTEMEILRNHVAEMGKNGRHYFSPGENLEKRKEISQLLKILLEK